MRGDRGGWEREGEEEGEMGGGSGEEAGMAACFCCLKGGGVGGLLIRLSEGGSVHGLVSRGPRHELWTCLLIICRSPM